MKLLYHRNKETTNLIKYDKKGNAINFEEVTEIIKIQKRHFKKGEFITMKKDFFNYLILESGYKFLEIKVLTYLINHLDFNNRIQTFTQKDIASYIGSTQPKVSNALKKLEEDKIIYKKGNDYYFSDKFIKYAGSKN